MLSFLVHRQIARMQEGFSTHVTFVWSHLLSGMDSHVDLQISTGGKRTGTEFALVRSFSGVDPVVDR